METLVYLTLAASVMANLILGFTVWVQISESKEDDRRLEEAAVRVDILHDKLDSANNRLVEHLVMMRREGFTPTPEDEPFEAYRLTPEMEADIEADRVGEG